MRLSIVLIAALLPVVAIAAPVKLTHTGYVLDGADHALTATLALRLRIVDDAGGGAILWEATCSAEARAGYYAVTLGEAPCAGSPALEDALFTGARWLEVAIGGTTLLPRTLLAAAPLAVRADSVPWTGLTGVPAGFADGTDDGTVIAAGSGITTTGAGTLASPLSVSLATDATSLAKVSGGKLGATAGGVDVTGTVTATAFAGNGALVTGVSPTNLDTSVTKIADAQLASGTDLAKLSGAQTVSGVKTFDPAGSVPFAVGATRTGEVANLNAERVSGVKLNALKTFACPSGQALTGFSVNPTTFELTGTCSGFTIQHCGANAGEAAVSCKAIRDACGATVSQTYWINTGSGALETYCDMQTDTGGWTLVFHAYDADPVPKATQYTVVATGTVITDPAAKVAHYNVIPRDGYALVKGAAELLWEYRDLSGKLAQNGRQPVHKVVSAGSFTSLFNSPSDTNYVAVTTRELHGALRSITSGPRLYWGGCATYPMALRFETFRDGSYYSPNCHMDTYGNPTHNPDNMDFATYGDGNGNGHGTVGDQGWGVAAQSHVYNLYVR